MTCAMTRLDGRKGTDIAICAQLFFINVHKVLGKHSMQFGLECEQTYLVI
jgi:hypothetical protein